MPKKKKHFFKGKKDCHDKNKNKIKRNCTNISSFLHLPVLNFLLFFNSLPIWLFCFDSLFLIKYDIELKQEFNNLLRVVKQFGHIIQKI